MSSAWYRLAMAQNEYELSDRLIRAITGWTKYPEDNIESLLEEGADVNKEHGTLLPLQTACNTGDIEIVKLLLDHGADVNAFDGFSRSALHYAAEKDVDCLKVLLQYGANPDAPDGNHSTPLHWACFRNNDKCVRALLEGKASVNAQDYNNDTALNWAALKGNLESVAVLLEYGAEVHTTNYNEASPILRAASIVCTGLSVGHDMECLKLLLKASGQFPFHSHNFSSVVTNDTEVCNMMTDYCSNVRSLRQLCRYVIRGSLGECHLPKRAFKLPLPPRIVRYILLQDGNTTLKYEK